ncbi:MAG: hypothetical protein AAGH46_05430 [Bacteroidota bacterium]
MKILNILIFSALFFSQASFAQEITTRHTFWGTIYYQNDQKLSLSDVAKITETNKKANELNIKAKKQQTISTVFSVLSGASLGLGIGLDINDKNGTPFYIAAGALFIPSAVYAFGYANNSNAGIDLYNIDLAKSGKLGVLEKNLKLSFMGNGFAMILSF